MMDKVTKTHLDSIIKQVTYFNLADAMHNVGDREVVDDSCKGTTICVIELKNGFSVIGKSSVVLLVNFNADIGREIAYNNAYEQLWLLEGYLLKDRLARVDENNLK